MHGEVTNSKSSEARVFIKRIVSFVEDNSEVFPSDRPLFSLIFDKSYLDC